MSNKGMPKGRHCLLGLLGLVFFILGIGAVYFSRAGRQLVLPSTILVSRASMPPRVLMFRYIWYSLGTIGLEK